MLLKLDLNRGNIANLRNVITLLVKLQRYRNQLWCLVKLNILSLAGPHGFAVLEHYCERP